MDTLRTKHICIRIDVNVSVLLLGSLVIRLSYALQGH